METGLNTDEEWSMSIFVAAEIISLMYKRFEKAIFNKYLDSISPGHQLDIIMCSLKLNVQNFFRDRDNGESKINI